MLRPEGLVQACHNFAGNKVKQQFFQAVVARAHSSDGSRSISSLCGSFLIYVFVF